MNIENVFSKYQYIWDDCNFGYVCSPNIFGSTRSIAIKECISSVKEFDFYPWNNTEKEVLRFPDSGFGEITAIECKELFHYMVKEAIAYGSEYRLKEGEISELLSAFVESVNNPQYYSNFSKSAWSPVTRHTEDSLLCVVGTDMIYMFFSCNDE